jgi:predicted RNase H-like HicB family nuclease
MTFTVEVTRLEDMRWRAEITDLPGCEVIGLRRDEALARVEALALQALATRLATGRATPYDADVTFRIPPAVGLSPRDL